MKLLIYIYTNTTAQHSVRTYTGTQIENGRDTKWRERVPGPMREEVVTQM